MLCAKCRYEKITVFTYDWLIIMIDEYEPKNDIERKHKKKLLKALKPTEESTIFGYLKNKIKELEGRIKKLEVKGG